MLVNLASVNPAQARDTAIWAAQPGAEYLDGSILADPQTSGRSRRFGSTGGSWPGFERHENALRPLGAATTWFEPDPERAAA